MKTKNTTMWSSTHHRGERRLDEERGRSKSALGGRGWNDVGPTRRSRSTGRHVGGGGRDEVVPSGRDGNASSGGGGFLGGILRRRKKAVSDHRASVDKGDDDRVPSRERTQENVCDYCRRVVKGKTREQMFRRLDYAYCDTECTKRHHAALNAEAGASYDVGLVTTEMHMMIDDVDIDDMGVIGFDSPPITPSAALLDVDSLGSDYCATFSTGGTSSSAMVPASREYDDELARQLRIAAREDEFAFMENEYHQGRRLLSVATTSRHRASDANHSGGGGGGPSFGTPGTYSTLSSNATTDGGCSDANLGVSSPGYYARRLTNTGAENDKRDSNGGDCGSRKDRRNRPQCAKSNDCSTPTESTNSLSSSSFGGMSNLDIGGLYAGHPQRRGAASPQRSEGTPNSRVTPPTGRSSDHVDDGTEIVVENATVDSWGIKSRRSNSGLSRAFEELSGWTTTGGAMGDDAKTPRASNNNKHNFGWNSSEDDANDHQGGGRAENDADPGCWKDTVDGNDSGSYRGLKIVPSTYNKNYDRHVSSISDTSLHVIDEDRPAGTSLQLLAQRKGLRHIDDSPSFHGKSPSLQVSSRVDHAVEDVVSIVSYYDDPSFDMFSLATNDTMTTISTIGPIQKHQRGRTGPNSAATASPGADRELMTKRTILTKAKGPKIIVQEHQQPRSDPPGILIDDVIKDGIHRRQRVERGGNNRRDPSRDPSHGGVDPEGAQQLMQTHENFEEERFRIAVNKVDNVPPQRDSVQRRLPSRGMLPSDNNHQYSRRLQHQDPFLTGIDPSVHGKEPIDMKQSMHEQDDDEQILGDEHVNRNNYSSKKHDQQHQHVPDNDDSQMGFKSAQIKQRQEQRSKSQYDSQKWQNNTRFTDNPEILAPSQLRPSMQEWQFQEQVEREESGRFDVAGIEFPIFEKDDNDSKLTGELEDELSVRGDDDTATNTLDTVDLVTEVKRVWRHVQRYEKKKHLKKQMKRQYLGNNQADGNVPIDENVLGNVDEDGAMEEMMQGNNPMAMKSMSLQSSQLCTPLKYSNDGGSKFSDITSSPLTQENTGYNRGRASDRPPMASTDGRLGTHIRCTSSHSRAHTPRRDSPEVDSTHAMASQASTRASTEKDVVFLNEGVDEFYDDRMRQTMKQDQNRNAATAMAHRSHPYTSSAHSHIPARSGQARAQFVNGVQRTKQNPGKYPAHSTDEGNVPTREEYNRILSQPYDMTKVKSTGTSITHATQQVSNLSTRSEMARKFMKQRQGHKPTAALDDHQWRNPQNFDGAGHTSSGNGNGYSNR